MFSFLEGLVLFFMCLIAVLMFGMAIVLVTEGIGDWIWEKFQRKRKALKYLNSITDVSKLNSFDLKHVAELASTTVPKHPIYDPAILELIERQTVSNEEFYWAGRQYGN